MSKTQRLTFAAIAAVIALVAVVVLAGGSGDDEPEQAATPGATATATATAGAEATPEATGTPTPEPTPEATEIAVAGGEVEGGLAEIDVEKGDRVRFSVKSDVADHVHVHGYDILRDVTAGGTARFSFDADIVGVFEVELEDSGVQVAKLTVEQ